MKAVLLLLILFSLSACTEDASPQSNLRGSNELNAAEEVINIRTYEELRTYLEQRYPGVEELPVVALISSGMDTTVPYKFRLEDGREFTVPIIFTRYNERIVDPAFDFNSLPE